MSVTTKLSSPNLNWREIPAWAAVVVGLVGILLTYSEIRTANEREIVFRVWDDARELYHSSLDFPGNSSESRVSIEMRLLSSINAHAGLLKDRSLVEGAWSVSRAWSVAHINATPQRTELTDAIGELIDSMEEFLGTYQPDWPPEESPSASSP